MKRLLFIAGALLSANVAAAQTIGTSKIYLIINGGYQLTANDFVDGAVRRENAEDGRVDSSYNVKAGPSFDIGGGGLVWRRLGVGVGVSRFTVSAPATVTGSVPHPFFFNRLRSANGESGPLTREELGVHVQLRAIVPAGNRFQVAVFGGPSFFQVKQGVVTGFTYTDSYPYDTAAFGSAATGDSSASKIGFNGGGDVAFFFARQVGIGITAQFAGTTVALASNGDATREVKVGGMKIGGGLRLRF